MSTHPMAAAQDMPLLQKYGFNELARQERLLYMGLGAADTATARLLNQRIIQPNARQIINDFYDYLLNLPAMRRFLPELLIPRLKRTQEEYLLSFGIDFDSPYYFEYRLRIGIAHERAGLTLDLYQAAYRQMTALMIACIPEDMRRDPQHCQGAINMILKIAALDMSLATDTYIAASVASMSDSIKQLSEQQRDLITAVSHDVLTGVYSRRHLLEVLSKMIHGKLRHGDKEFCIAMLDLDFFKKINDTHGHLVGDHVLQHVAKIMKQSIRGEDILGRYGGEEFMIIFPGTSLAIATQTADRIRQSIADHPLVKAGITFAINVSVGVAGHLSGETDYHLIERADKALYAAKAAGRNCVKTAAS